MPILHQPRDRRTPAERELAAAIARADARVRAMQARVDLLEEHIRATRRFVVATGMLDAERAWAPPAAQPDERFPAAVATPPAGGRQGQRPRPGFALSRALLRSL